MLRLWFTVASSFVGDPEEPAVKPGALGSGAGFLQPGRAGPAPAAHPHAIPPTSGNRARLLSAETRAQTELSASPHARRCPPSQGKSPPRFPRRGRPARTYLGPPGSVEGKPPGAAQPPVLRPRVPRVYEAGTAAKWTRGADGPRPDVLLPPALRSASPAEPRLCSASRGSPFPRGGRPRVRGGGSPSGISNRRLQPPARAARGAEGRAPGGALREGCARPRGAVPGAPGRGRGSRGPAGWAPAERGRQEAAWFLVEPPGKEAGARRRWLGLDCCTFFFVRCIFRNKKKSPTLHTASSASLTTRSSPQRLGGD